MTWCIETRLPNSITWCKCTPSSFLHQIFEHLLHARYWADGDYGSLWTLYTCVAVPAKSRHYLRYHPNSFFLIILVLKLSQPDFTRLSEAVIPSLPDCWGVNASPGLHLAESAEPHAGWALGRVARNRCWHGLLLINTREDLRHSSRGVSGWHGAQTVTRPPGVQTNPFLTATGSLASWAPREGRTHDSTW